jgi:16S rRNA (guanine966-N2)-methyltransferase
MKQKKSELPRKPRVPRHAAPLANEIRIIGGDWKRTKLAVADRPGLRPTPDRVRETLFNWLGQDLTGWRCIDVFAGTGVLGFEAASRGAKEVQLVELDTALVAQLKRTQIQLKANATQVVRGDGIVTLKQMNPASMDVIFLDPPFDSVLFEPALAAASRVVAQDGFVYLEAPVLWTDEQVKGHGLMVHRHLKAGAVHAHILKRLASLPVA